MNLDEKFRFLCTAESFSRLAENAVVPTWRTLLEDPNIFFLATSEEEKKNLASLTGKDYESIADRVVSSFESFAEAEKSFGLLSCDGSAPTPSECAPNHEIVRVSLACCRSNPDLEKFLEKPFVQTSDLVSSDFLPEESVIVSTSSTIDNCLDPTPANFTFAPPQAPSFSKPSKSGDSPLLWIVDPSSMVSGPINQKVATVLGKMETDQRLQVVQIETGASANDKLTEQIGSAGGIIAVTGDPALGHFLVRSACLLNIPAIFPIEEPCSPFRFNAHELKHYLDCNNFGRAGLSIRALLAKAVQRAKDWQNEQTSAESEPFGIESPSDQWRRLIEETKGTEGQFPPSPNGHDLLRMGDRNAAEAPDFPHPSEIEDAIHDVSLVAKPWMKHPTFTKAVLALNSCSDEPEGISLKQGIADLLAEHLLALKPTPGIAARLFRNIALHDPAWLKRTSEQFLKWRIEGIFLDAARCLQASHPEISELIPGNLSARKEEYQGIADLLTVQVNSLFFSPFIAPPLLRFLSALGLVAERNEVIKKVCAAYPKNEKVYRATLSFWGLVSGHVEDCKSFAPDYNDSSNLVLSHGHLFLFTGMATGSLPEPEKLLTIGLTKGYFEKWIKGSAWDRVVVSFCLSWIGMEEEA
ncbi:MAG: hypothetical protein VB980_00695, partial [Opitutales bacterium]